MPYESILVEKEQGIATITLNRPDKMNAFNQQLFKDLIDALLEVDADDEVKVTVLTGAGRAFSAGLDLDQAKNGPSEKDMRVVPVQNTVAWIPQIIRNMRRPIIASLNGACAGAGFSIVIACDMRIAGDNVKIGAPFFGVGLVPELGSTYNLPRLIGIAKACELVYTGKIIDAQEAKEIGLFNQIVPKDELATATKALATQIASQPGIAIQLARKAMYQGMDNDLASQIQFEQLAQSGCFKSADHHEGIMAFLEKRRPNFTGK